MNQEIENLLMAQPFVPFRMHLSDGTTYDITHPEQVILTGWAVHIGVGIKSRRIVDHVDRCALSHVVRIEESLSKE